MEDKLVIQAKRQDNGLWEVPLNCIHVDVFTADLSEENQLKRSAIIVGLSEVYKNEKFKIFYNNKDGFVVKLSKSGLRHILYEDYKLDGNTIIWIG